MEHQSKESVVQDMTRFGIPKQLVLLTQHHESYWVRLISHRLLGHIFAFSTESKGNLITMLGLDIPEQIVDLTFNLIDGLRKPVYSDDMQDQIVKNLIFLTNHLIELSQGPKQISEIKDCFKIEKLYRKVSYIGRRVMLDIRTSKDRLQAILKFYKLSLLLLK